MHVLALDFDGVICDSAPECFAVALETFLDLGPAPGLAAERDRITAGGGGGWSLESICASALYRSFVIAMPLGNRAEDFGVVLGALDAGQPLDDQVAYDTVRSQVTSDWLDRFHRRFYERRSAFAREDPARWRSLLATYPFFVDLLRRRRADATLAIATAKDRPSVERLLVDYGIADLFLAERVLDKETGVHKTAHLRALAERLEVGFDRITFVDDKVNHLEAVEGLGVRCALAAWGYNGEREWRIAERRGYLVCHAGDAESKLFGDAATDPPARSG